MSRITKGSKGSVYLFVNGSMPGVIKVGSTADDPHVRAQQLTASTSSPTPFYCAYFRLVDDCTEVERAMHDHFVDRRVNRGREFFQLELHEAITVLDRLANGHADLGIDLSFAELFATFPDDGSSRELTAEEQAQCRALESRR